jgi:hypothetical protein
MNLLGGSTTNAPAEEIPIDDGPLNLLSFDRLTLEPLKGIVQIDNLQVGNPKSFANKNIVMLKLFRIDLDPDTLAADTLLIRDILIDSPTIAYERQLTTDNIKALQSFVAAATEKREEELGKEEPPAEEAGAGQKVIIEHVLVKDGLVKAKLSALPTAPIPLPDVEMKDIGKESGGTSFGEALSNIGGTLYDSIIGSVSSVTGFAGDALKGAGTLTFGALGTVTGGATDNLGQRMGIGGETSPEPTAEAAQTEPKPERLRVFHKGGLR